MEKNKMYTAGSVRVSEEVIIKIARTAACEIEGVSFRQNGGGARAVLAGLTAPIQAKLNGETAAIKLNIYVGEGVNAAGAAENVQKSVKSAVQNMTGFTVTKVDVNIAGVIFEDSGAASAENG